MLVRFIIVLLCISAQIGVYLQTRKYLKKRVCSNAPGNKIQVDITLKNEYIRLQLLSCVLNQSPQLLKPAT